MIALVLALLLAQSADDLGYGTTACIGNPPTRFQHNNWMIVQFVDPNRLAKECDDPDAIACTDGHRVWMLNSCKAKEAADLSTVASDLCHELGHVNGWPGDHPER